MNKPGLPITQQQQKQLITIIEEKKIKADKHTNTRKAINIQFESIIAWKHVDRYLERIR